MSLFQTIADQLNPSKTLGSTTTNNSLLNGPSSPTGTPPAATPPAATPPAANPSAASTIPPATAPPTPTIPPYTPATATGSGYTATPYTVAPNQTVQDQVKQIVGKDSPLMQQAATIAKGKMSERGIINSSIGIEAGQNAVIAQALPIAQQDANTYNQAMTNTANQQNAASQFTAGAGNTASLANAASINNAFAQSLQTATTLTNTTLNNETQVALANLDSNTKTALTTMDNQYKQLLQTNLGASNAYVQAVTNIANIAVNKELNQTAKDMATNTQMNMLNEQLRTMAGIASTQAADVVNLDLNQYFQADIPAQITAVDTELKGLNTNLARARSGELTPAYGEPDASERRKVRWDEAVRNAQDAVTAAQARRAALVAQQSKGNAG